MTSPVPETPIFDPIAIEKLRKVAGDQDAGFVAEMAQLFSDETAKSLTDLRSGFDRRDWKLVSRVAHSLKSSAATLGLMRLSSACKALEIETQNGTEGAQIQVLVATVFAEFEIAAPVLKNLR
jgi:two-component system, sensor histidine kinase